MDEIFKNMELAKRDRIINSALQEFSKNGFEKASTNRIVDNANISKGLLFHYFANKKELYDKLEEFIVSTVRHAIEEEMDWNKTDFFDRLEQILQIKGRLTQRYPYIYDFVKIILEEKTFDNLREQTKGNTNDLENRIYTKNIDFSKFRDDIELEKIMNIISWTFEKFGEELIKKQILNGEDIDYPKMEGETEQYINILKKVFYK